MNNYMVQARHHTSAKDVQHLASWEVNPPMYQRGVIGPIITPPHPIFN